MTRHRPDWAARAPRIAYLASLGLSDAAIGDLFGVRAAVIQDARRRHGIPAGWHQRAVPQPVAPAPPAETVTIDGVTYCPPRWAEGATPDHRVRPRRK